MKPRDQVRLLAEPAAQVLGYIGGREKPERQIGTAMVDLEGLLDLANRMFLHTGLSGPIRADNEQPRRVSALCQKGQQVDRGDVAPMEILEH
ncbi:MAG TPA: hypothetical protein VMW17_18400 [Candidatus Binatia bacterium]|nr:hypothetical protein [Candidatus Binatia bacterium]